MGFCRFLTQSYCASDLLVWGIGLSILHVPVHAIHLYALVSGPVCVGVHDQLPVSGVDLILRNNLAGKEVFPKGPEVTKIPTFDTSVFCLSDSPPVFPACVVTHARTLKLGEQIDLADSFLCAPEKVDSPYDEHKNICFFFIFA